MVGVDDAVAHAGTVGSVKSISVVGTLLTVRHAGTVVSVIFELNEIAVGILLADKQAGTVISFHELLILLLI